MEASPTDDDLDMACVVCGLKASEAPVQYMHDPVSLTVYGYCNAHYSALLVACYGEETAEAMLPERFTQQPT